MSPERCCPWLSPPSPWPYWVPSEQIATRGDLLLAVLVVLTALGIAPHELWDLRTRFTPVLALSLAPFLALVPLAWVLSRLFDSPVREGVLTLGLSSTEVAAVGLVALAGGDAALALGALAGSLIAAAILGPLLIGLLAADAASTDSGALLGRFALVVLIPLVAGVAARTAAPRLARGEPWYAAGSTLAVAALIYAALSDTSAGNHLAPALAASAAFLALSAVPAIAAAGVVYQRSGPRSAWPLPCGISRSPPHSPRRPSAHRRPPSPGSTASSCSSQAP